MTIDKAIERYSHNAEYERANGNLQGCLEFKQLADWLKDYKRLKEQESKEGHWVFMEASGGRDSWKCSVCGRRARGKLNELPYCHCGARMNEVNE